MKPIRKIVKDAFKVDELVHQFSEIDLEDGLLETGNIIEVNEKYSDAHILYEAKWKLEIAQGNVDADGDLDWIKDAKQLRKFISKWDKKSEIKNGR